MGLKESINNQTDVALGITKQLLLTEAKDSNVVYSPLSIYIVLSLVASGTKGPTLTQLLSFLKTESTAQLNSLASKLVRRLFSSSYGGAWSADLTFANGLWVDKSLPFKPVFKQVADTDYKAALNQADFKTNPEEARGEVNSWAEKKTNGLIPEVLPDGAVDDETRLIFANALYFKATWNKQFDASETKEFDFYLPNGTSVKAPFMTAMKTGSKVQCAMASDGGFKVLKLPYKEVYCPRTRSFSMYLFLPDARDGLPAMIEKVCTDSGFLNCHLPKDSAVVGEFRIPKFKFACGFEASKILKDLGLVLPFVVDPSKGGNVTEMVDSPPGEDPYVSDIYHKAFIEVNEQGTQAAAVTAVSLSGGGVPPFIGDFVADHPFMFLIREENSGTVLFIGQLLNPLAN